MISGENLFSNLLTITVLGLLTLIVYLKLAKKTFVEFVQDMRGAFSDKADEASEYIPTGFQDIR